MNRFFFVKKSCEIGAIDENISISHCGRTSLGSVLSEAMADKIMRSIFCQRPK